MTEKKPIRKLLTYLIAALLSVSVSIPQYYVFADDTEDVPAEQAVLQEEAVSGVEAQTVTTANATIDSITRGSVKLALDSGSTMDGFDTGDIVSVKIGEREPIELPFINGHVSIGFRKSSLNISSRDGSLNLRMSSGNFAEFYGVTDADIGASVVISMKEKGGYADEIALLQIGSMSDDRSEFPNLSDEEFANYRCVTTAGMRKGVLYRTSSPLDPGRNRNAIADDANRKYGVTTIINLAEDSAKAESHPGYDSSYYKTVNHYEANMGVSFATDSFNHTLADCVRYMIAHPGIYEVNCIFGKDRTGFVIAVLEGLMGASYDELVSDYAATYPHFYPQYNNCPSPAERNRAIAESNLIAQLEYAYGVDDLKTADIKAATEDYLMKIGISSAEIEALRYCLADHPKEITPVIKLSAESYTYNGKVRTPSVSVYDGATLLSASDYTVTYDEGRKNVGRYSVHVELKGNYAGSGEASFKINPRGTKIRSIKKGRRFVWVKWRKQSAKMSKTRVSGYQVQIAYNKRFTEHRKTYSAKGYRKESRRIGHLKSGRTYYVRVRTYKVVNKTRYFSPWSKELRVRTR